MMQYPAHTYKNRLQEYAQKKSLPWPVYHTVNEGKDHLPQFRCTVTINETEYKSPPGFSHKKAAQNAAAKEAVEDLQRQGFKFKERKRPKCVLAEYASMKNMPPPTYRFVRDFQATVEINGASYSGAPAKNLKEAANKAALEAIWAIDPRYYVALCHNDSEQPTGQSHTSKSESKRPSDNLTPNHELVGGTECQSAENVSEKLNVEDAPVLGKETGDIFKDKECGSEEIEKKQQSNDEVDVIESISKRNRIEYQNDEQRSERTKKHKGEKRNGAACHSQECTVTYPVV